MVAIASPAARAKARGPRKQVHRSQQVEEAVQARQRKRARKAASGGGSKARVACDADKKREGGDDEGKQHVRPLSPPRRYRRGRM